MSSKPVHRPITVLASLLLVLCSPNSNLQVLASEQSASVTSSAAAIDPFLMVDKKLVTRWLKPNEYMPTSEIKPGMEGYGLSVFQGTKPERFNVKVIGVVKKVLNGRDAIMVRLSGPQIGKNSVIRGMSGSPVYLNNKIIGAISYGFDFSTEPIAGVTPIADMLDALSVEEHTQPERISARPSPSTGDSSAQSVATMGGSSGPVQLGSGAPRLVPLMAPVSLAGFSSRAQEFLSERLKDQGLWVSSGAAGGLDPSLIAHQSSQGKQLAQALAENPVPPGGAISVMLTTGDFNSSACGTATMTFGNKVLAFGHPFLQAGAVDFPMATAFVHQILPNLSVSFKVSSPIQVIGSFLADRPWAVSGQIGRTAKMIPVTYTVLDQTRHLKRVYHCQIVDHPDLTPELVAATAMSAVDATHQSSGPYILKVKSAIDADKIGTIERLDRYSSNLRGDHSKLHIGGDPVGSFLLGTTSKILDNDFEQASIKSVNLDIELQDGHDTAKIERVYVDKPIVAPGETLKISCVIRPYNQETVTKTLSMVVPRDVPDGNILLGVASGDDIDLVRKRMGLVDPAPENLGQIVKRIRDAGSGDDLIAVMALPQQSILVNGVVLPDPPAQWTKLFSSDRYTRGPAFVKAEVKTREPEDWLLDDSHIMTVEVRRADKAEVKSAPLVISTHGSQPSPDGMYITDLAKKTMEAGHKSDSKEGSLSSSTATDSKTTTPAAAFWSVSKEYPHMRSLQVWNQENQSEFLQGKTDSTTIDSWGRILPALENISEKRIQSDMRIWSATAFGGVFLFATSNGIYKWKGDNSEPVKIGSLNSLLIPALVVDSKGTLYAADVPNGQVIALSPGPADTYTQRVAACVPEKVISSLCTDGDYLYIGVSSTGRVYKAALSNTTAAAKPTLLFDSGQAAVTSLFFSKSDNRLYVGTAEKGSVYSLDDKGTVRAEYQSPNHIVTGIVRDVQGDIYVATAGQGQLIKIGANGTISTLASSEAFYTLLYDPLSDHVFSGDAEGDITEAMTDPLSKEPYFLPVCHTEQDAVLALASDDKSRLFAGTSNLALARTFEMHPSDKASYTSVVRDGQRKSRWSRLRAYGAYNEVSDAIGQGLKVETRTGETSQPDASWSSWREGRYSEEAYTIASPPGRYLQYRLTWKQSQSGSKGGAEERPISVGKVEVTYLPSNVAPEFSAVSLKTGAALSGKQDIAVSGNDGDGDNLALSIEVSCDGAKTWQTIACNLRAHHAETRVASGLIDKAREGHKEHTSGSPEDRKQSSLPGIPISYRALNPARLADSTGGGAGYLDSEGDKQPPEQQPSQSEPKSEEPKDDPGKDDQDKSKGNSDKSADKDSDKDSDKEADKDTDSDKDKEANQSKDSDKKSLAKDTGKERNRIHRVPSESQPKAADQSGPGEKFTWNWDTTKVKDGSYVVKLVLDDLPSNPSGHLQTVALRTIDVDNTPPEITAVQFGLDKDRNTAHLQLHARDKQTPIANATYRIDDGEPFALGNADLITDGLDVEFSVKDIALPPGSHKLEIQVTDKAGNTATKTVNIK